MKKKKDRNDPVANPQHRIIRVSKAGNSKVLATRQVRSKKTIGMPIHYRYNGYAKRYEFILEFYNERVIYQVTADQLDWERVIADLQRAFAKVEELIDEQSTEDDSTFTEPGQ